MAATASMPVASDLRIPDPEPSADVGGPIDEPQTPSSQNAWARFEFETGHGNEGTKILMVEWNPVLDDNGNQIAQHKQSDQGGWDVSWEGKTTRFPVSEKDGNAAQRVFFLIPANDSVPPVVTISQPSTGRTLVTRPMPAIYMPALGVDTQKDAGRRGVLHTMWAKKRLSQLQEEIHAEMQNNSEGVALLMAIQDRDYIVEHFGLEHPEGAQRPPPDVTPPIPQSPRSPIGGRLGEKLRGLKLATSPWDLANHGNRKHHLYSLSPDASDIAVPSRAAFSSAAARHNSAASGVASLNAIVEGDKPSARPAFDSKPTEEDLFALPMSPRSPEMTKSPFSLL